MKKHHTTLCLDKISVHRITMIFLFQIIDQNLQSGKTNFGKTHITYIIDNAQQYDSGIYTCQSEYTTDVNLTLHIDEGDDIFKIFYSNKRLFLKNYYYLNRILYDYQRRSKSNSKHTLYFPIYLQRCRIQQLYQHRSHCLLVCYWS